MKFSFKMFALIAFAIVMSSNLMAQASITSLNEIRPGTAYKILNAHDGRALCTLHNAQDPANKGNQEPLIVYDYYGNSTQHWAVPRAGKGNITLLNRDGGRALCTLHNSGDPIYKGNQEGIIQYDYYGDATQHYRLKHVSDGNWTIISAHDGRALCTLHNSKNPAHRGNQENVIVYDYYGDATQLWKIVPVN